MSPSCQIFVAGPRGSKITIDQNDIDAIKDNTTSIVIHGAYIDNPWNHAPGSIINIRNEMAIAVNLGATGVVVHLSNGAADDTNLRQVIRELNSIDDQIKQKVILWLEVHTAKSSNTTYETPEKIGNLFRRIKMVQNSLGPLASTGVPLRIGFCIDTAHLFACGVSLATRTAARTWINGLKTEIPDVPLMLHLNDSASTLGSGIDEHASLCQGNIWREYRKGGPKPFEDSGLFEIINWASELDLVTILERKEYPLEDLKIISELGAFRIQIN
jgi:deoxyribonuclease-4